MCLLPATTIVINRFRPLPVDDLPRKAPVPFPYHLDLTWPGEFQKWLADRADRRLPLRRINAAYQVGVLRRSIDARVFTAPDGWLFWTDEGDSKPATMGNFRGKLRLTDSEVRNIEQLLIGMNATLSSCNVPSLLVIAPDKQSIYGEHLAPSARPQKTMLDDLLPRLSPQSRSLLIDLRQPLRAAKAKNPHHALYYRTGSHWNLLGAFYAYQAIIAALAKTMPIVNLTSASLDRYVIQAAPFKGGDLAINMLSAPWWLPDTILAMKRKSGPAEPGVGRLVILGDSFSAALQPYLQENFSAVDFTYFSDQLPVQHDKPSAVLLEIVERYLPVLPNLKYDWARFCVR
jgi:hypothetical protein